MYQNSSVFTVAGALARHAVARQDLAARNMANADTPGYAARDLPEFETVFTTTGGLDMRRTRPGHLDSSAANKTTAPVTLSTDRDPNGNSVSLEGEMMRAAEIRHQHDMALAVYKSAMGVLRTALGRGA